MGLNATIVTTAPFFPPAEGEIASTQQRAVKSLEKYFPCLVVVNFLDLAKSVEDVNVCFELYPGGPDAIMIVLDFAGQMDAKDQIYACDILQEQMFKWLGSQDFRVDIRVVTA
jgi:hypothetical protein